MPNHYHLLIETSTDNLSKFMRQLNKLEKMLLSHKDIRKRHKQILKAYTQGYSQHMIAKVLGISQPAVSGVIKRSWK